MIAPVNSAISIPIGMRENKVSHDSQRDSEYQQPKVSERQNYQNQLMEIADDMSMVATQFSQRYGKWLDKKAERGNSTLYITEEGADKKLDHVLKMFKQSSQNLQDLLAYLRQMFPDDSDLIMVLRELVRKKKLGAQLDAEIEHEIERMLEGEKGKNIRAGINVALKAKIFAKLLSLNPTVLRDLYRSYIDLNLEPIYFFQILIEEYDSHQCTTIFSFLTQSLLCDMQSLMPSCAQSSEFGLLLERVNQLRALHSFITLSMEKFKPEGLQHTLSEKQLYNIFYYGMTLPEEMSDYLVKLLEKEWVNLLITVKMKILQIIKSLFNQYPESLYLSQKFREDCQEIIQSIMDKYIHIEKFQLRKQDK